MKLYGLNVDSLKEAIELIMLSTLLDQLASFQLASAQLASFQLASAQLASLQLACAHEAPLFRYWAQLAASKERDPVTTLVPTNLYRPTFGFGGLSIVDATPASISPTPPALSLTFGR